MFPFHTVLCPIDFSAHSRCAFRLAARLAGESSARLIVLHVNQLLPEPLAPGHEPGQRLAKLRHVLARFNPFDPRIHVEHRLVEGDPAGEIMRAARAAGCDLIVMGTHGRTGLDRLLLGSVAEDVMRKASCPVLTVRGPEAAPGTTTPPTERVLVAAR
jgi:nucleotide-binding universal stress UspA family protein